MLISTTSLLSAILLLTPLSSSSRWSVDSFILPSYKVVQSPLPQCHLRQHRTQHTTTTAYANSKNNNNNTWRSAIRTPTAPTNTLGVIRDLCNSTPCRKPNRSEGESGLAFLFVSQQYADSFEEIVAAAYDSLVAEGTTAGSTPEEAKEDFTLLSIVGGGVIGDGLESDDPNAPAISLLTGILPKSAQVEVFMFGNDDDDNEQKQQPLPPPPPPSSTKWNKIGHQQDLPSYIVFADPFSKIQETLNGLDSSGNGRQEGSAVVAGGISCPILSSGNDTPPLPTMAVNNKAYPRGTIVGIGLSGSVGLHVAVAQGCRPVGMTYEVTKADGNFIEELDGRPALDVLGEFSEGLDEQDKQTIQTYGIMVGLATPGGKDVNVGDYLIRQILGFRAPAVMVGAEVNVGDLLKFHVRDPAAALHDMQNMIGRYRTERMFANNGGIPLAALQISCVARGRSLFGSPNVDVGCVKGLFSQGVDSDDDENKVPPAIGGFYANGEIGPTGIAGVGIAPKATHMHGFTTVACTIVDFSRDSLSSSSAAGAEDASMTSQVDNDAWG
jgi:small ligand-binding sensory domain FIST